MNNEIQKYGEDQQSLALVLSKLTADERIVLDALNKFNQLRKFGLTAIQLLEWKDSIFQAYPEIDPMSIVFVVDKMICGELEYRESVGIQNIFNALKRIEREGSKFKIKPDMTW